MDGGRYERRLEGRELLGLMSDSPVVEAGDVWSMGGRRYERGLERGGEFGLTSGWGCWGANL